MGLFQNHMMAAAVAATTADTGYSVDNSLCLNSGDSPYLSKTFAGAGDRKTWTFSCWLKQSRMLAGDGNYGGLFRQALHYVGFRQTAALGRSHFNISGVFSAFGGGALTDLHRDPSAWYHFVFIFDTTQAVAGNRIKMYVNNTLLTITTEGGSPPALNYDGPWMNNAAHELFRASTSDAYIFDGYVAEVIVCDGSALPPSNFGETNTQGVWVPKKISGLTFGTNGFYLDFQSSGDLGNDVSGNNNDWTSNNLASTDQSTDTPTNNHCTVNAIDSLADTWTITEGNRFPAQAANNSRGKCNFGIDSADTDGWYWECELDAIPSAFTSSIGILPVDNYNTGNMADPTTNVDAEFYGVTNQTNPARTYKHIGGSSSSLDTVAMTAGQIFGVAVKGNKIWIAKDNTWFGSGDPSAGSNELGSITAGLYHPVHGARGGTSGIIFKYRFAEAEWTYSAPTGFKAICTANIPEPAIKDGSTNFQMDDFAGTGSSNARTFGGNSDMQPDILWIKAKNTTTGWIEFNAAVGVQKYNTLNEQGGETSDSNSLTAFNTDGFTVVSLATVNSGSYGFFAFGWSAGGSGSSNTAGSINTTTTIVDTTAGISVGTYTGTGSGATVGHGLGVTPATVIIFPRSNGDHKLVANWQSGISAYGEKWKLNDTEAASSSSNQITAASSTTFTLGTDTGVNGSSRTYSYYAFAEVPGFSKFGTYTGNGNADGAFLYCGFKPAIIIAKCDRAGEDWIQFNTKTDPNGNPAINYAYPNDTAAFTNSANFLVDFLSNGIKMRGTESRINRSGNAIVFMAFAENPFGGDGVSPATAR